jgi:hypothetical protein
MPAAQKKALGLGSGKPSDKGRMVLTAEDLAEALKEVIHSWQNTQNEAVYSCDSQILANKGAS